MNILLKFHHIGYATLNINETSDEFTNLGYTLMGEVQVDKIQKVKICFLEKENAPLIELVEPLQNNSLLNKFLDKNGVFPYHICYEVDDIDVAFDYFTVVEDYIPLFRPIEAVALNDKKICYFFKKGIGYIELKNK